ncbi:STAS domain-containing protein [Streptomyces filamentosus]|uniref:Anti-sigma factor antagonist n=1 Tax=Streptomyces filamentosus TaxID=67294 RepID=A0A919ESU8_STRFL|nr:STAS domain-containing protein [Streptomyces filamentosus]GHG28144.1 anti-sigma factor antagonist [Streptomyces filamentosus]
MTTPDHLFGVEADAAPDGILYVTLAGDLAWESADELLDAVRARLSPGNAPAGLRVDCAGLTLCDSTGLSALLALHRLAEAAGVPLHLDRRPSFLDRLLLLTGTYEHLTGRSETAGPDADTPSGTVEGPRPGGP